MLVETWFEEEQRKGWALPSAETTPFLTPFFPTPPTLNTAGTLWVQPLKAYELRNMETMLFTQDPFVTVTLQCGDDDNTTVHTSTAFDKGKQASWEEAPLALPYTATMGNAATATGSTPYLLVQVFDKNTVTSNVLIGQVEGETLSEPFGAFRSLSVHPV